MNSALRIIVILLCWSLAALALGILGARIGPGAVMVFAGAIWGVCGAVMSWLLDCCSIGLPRRYAGALIALVSAGASILPFYGETDSAGMLFILLFLFQLVPSYLVYFLVLLLIRRMPGSVVA